MTYVVSDIHGCDKKYFRLLEMLHFSDNDTLYILGDVTDRGSGGLRVLLDAASRQNVILLRGNHEQAALEFLPRDPDNEATPARLFARWYEWMEDGGDRTYRAFWNRSEAVRARVLRILGSLPVYAEVQAGGRGFFLAHTVPGKRKMRHPESCRVCDFLTGEPEYELCYDPTASSSPAIPLPALSTRHRGGVSGGATGTLPSTAARFITVCWAACVWIRWRNFMWSEV